VKSKENRSKKPIGKKIIEFKLGDIIPEEGKFLYAKEKLIRKGFISNPQHNYETIFYYEVPSGYKPMVTTKKQLVNELF
jgi:hypothetical protein